MRKEFFFGAALVVYFSGLPASLAMAQVPWAPGTGAIVETRVDTFDDPHDYKAASFPSGTIWTGIHSKDNGGATAVVSSAGGQLTIEDLREHFNPNGEYGVGFEGTGGGGSNNAPFLYTTINSGADFDAFAKISSQWNGNWSKTGIVARVSDAGLAQPTIGKDRNGAAFAATENFISAAPFLPQNNFQVQRVTNGADAGTLTGAVADRGIVPADAFETDPIWVAMIKRLNFATGSGTFTFYTSTDNVATPNLVTNWVNTNQTANSLPFVASGVNVEVGLTHHEFFAATSGGGIPAGQRPAGVFDYFGLNIYQSPDPPPSQVWTWRVDSDGNWGSNGNWTPPGGVGPSAPGIPPNGSSSAYFGPVITAPRTVVLNVAAGLKRVTFDNVNTYAIAGSERLTMQATSGNARIDALRGSHIVQTPVTLNSTTDVVASAGAQLDFTNEFNINGQTVNVSGPGQVFINNIIDAGASGVINSTGNLGGSGRINGALVATGGSVNPGSSAGTLTVDNGYSQNASTTLKVELAGTTAGHYDQLAVTGDASLAGIVDVSVIAPFASNIGDSWDIVTATGTLTSTATLAPANAEYYSLSVVGDNTLRLTLTSPSLAGDYNGDHVINAADYTIYRNRKAGIGGTALPNDPTPGSIDFSDYEYWKSQYGGAGSGTSLGDSSSVPEPTAIVLLLLGIYGFWSLVRRF